MHGLGTPKLSESSFSTSARLFALHNNIPTVGIKHLTLYSMSPHTLGACPTSRQVFIGAVCLDLAHIVCNLRTLGLNLLVRVIAGVDSSIVTAADTGAGIGLDTAHPSESIQVFVSFHDGGYLGGAPINLIAMSFPMLGIG
jgi:hypothetical protein